MDPVTPDHRRREGAFDVGRHRGRHLIDFVLVEPSHPGNVGAAARALQVMGFERLTVVNPRVEKVHQHRDARALASGAFRVLDTCRLVATLDEALASAQLTIAISAAGREFAPPPQSPRETAAQVRALIDRLVPLPTVAEISLAAMGVLTAAPVALVFGTERVGLSVAQAQRCQRLCSIDADPQYTSLNLAQALQIMAYELRTAMMDAAKAPLAPFPGDEGPAPHAQIEAMFEHLERMLVTIGFLDPANPKRLMPRLRRLFGRAGLASREVDILRGICGEVEKLAAHGPRS